MTGKTIAVIGGTGGLGRSVVQRLLDTGNRAVVFGRAWEEELPGAEFVRFNLLSDEIASLRAYAEGVDALVVVAGAARTAPFEELSSAEVARAFQLNAEAPAEVLHAFYDRLRGADDFYCAVVGSVAGLLASPLLAAYGAAKAAVAKLVESLNAELAFAQSPNRILGVYPGYIAGTRFHGGENDMEKTLPLADELLRRMEARQTEWIPRYEETYRGVLERYAADPCAFAQQSIRYKTEQGRARETHRGRVGFLTGTFDLFHIGHLNLLRRAKQYCDYLVVGVHPATSKHKNKPVFVPLEERMAIVRACRYVDEVVVTLDEDDAMYERVHYDLLFVGSDYQGTERFSRYEQKLGPLGVKIVYFPYTQGTSSTQLRKAIERD